MRGELISGVHDFIAVTETWLNDTIPDSLLLYDTEFFVARCDRVEQRGGGVALFYKKSFKVAPVFIDSCFSSVEVVAVDVISSSLCTIRIICAYCPPDYDPINVSLLIECISSLCFDRVVCL
ncbi:MAG: endonuclease/exonuclease/phosphatase family protein, partial [Gammaproteobacteria bacterium]|nr:endonuclease/exonuclease/phosphatase family protein [Gammaproteobacteria bacterium]